MQPAHAVRLVGLAVLANVAGLALNAPSALAADPDPTPLTAARGLWLKGKYAEAQESYQALTATEPVAAALGLARCQGSVGEVDAALTTLSTAAKDHPKAAELPAELARLTFDRGDFDQAQTAVEAALKLAPDQLLARWIQAELWRSKGDLAAADAGYKWFVDYYNEHEVASVEDLRWIGAAAAQFARWNRLSDQFTFLVSELYPDSLKLDPDWWFAPYEAGLLFLEKYNQAEASRELKAALLLNPNSAEVHAALARLALQNYELESAQKLIERALELNPGLAEAHRCQADVALANFQPAKAAQALEEALRFNPRSEETLGRLAAAYAVLDGPEVQGQESRLARLEQEAVAHNPHAGEFYYALAGGLDLSRKFPSAARYYEAAVKAMPQLTAPRGALGLMYMRLGDEGQAKQILTESFDVDPFNLRVSNSLKVLEVLDDYAVLESEHFVIKYDRVRDELLARYASRYLEQEVYPGLVAKFGFEPEGKSLFEIFSRARNTNGHGWFSARMVGLPYVGTVGACAGKMVALASPNDMPKKYNWARVLKHEFVHVLNLQQTGFNIPHWFTEALAVESEGYPRPQIWNELLAQRVPSNDLFNLDTINLGFIRPKSGLDWQMAYCQAQIYAQYMLATYGDDALAKMLSAYKDNLDTPAALMRSFNVQQADFESGYREHLNRLVAGLSAQAKPAEMKFAELERARAADPANADLTARLAQAYLNRKEYPKVRKLALEAAEVEPQQQLAAYVLARIHLVVGETDAAQKVLTDALQPNSPESNLLNLLAGLHMKAKRYDEAARLYELGASHEPSSDQWTKALARVYLVTKDRPKLATALARLAQAEADDATFRKKLAQMSLEDKNYAEAARWASQANQVDVLDAEIHWLWAQALAGAAEYAQAWEEFAVAVQLNPEEPAWRLAWAEACVQAKQPELARGVLEELLKLSPDHESARRLLESLQP